MELKEVIEKRQSIRSFLDKKIPREIIDELIKYANLAPSAGNLQSRDFIIIDNMETKEKLCKSALHQKFVLQAPIIIIVCSNLKRISSYATRGKELYTIQDASAAVEHLLLLAVEYDLATCWIGSFNENILSEVLELPSYIRPVAVIPIGYSNDHPKKTSRLDIKSLIHINKW